ncbi:MAG: DNA polymerase III subunit beta [SAR324 cluster bacterium]|uniref:Beta sliding clamp n=1 Tax=SAR324 cluster bacterium TaxID=2024889 RepID=A0A7X9ILJ5_9DELT|nr:DNA polymerase III subunit beta [SAR324 cluster bacterium]
MNLTISKTELSRGLYLTQSIVEKRTTMPILVNLLLTASNGDLSISATDLEITSVVRLNASVSTRGSTTINAKVLGDIVKELPEGDVKLELTEAERLEISAGKSKFRVIGTSSEEYPGLPGVNFDVTGKIKARQLFDMINKTIYAVSHDETRYNLSGVCFDTGDSVKGSKKKEAELKMVATDGHRLAMIVKPMENIPPIERVIVPRKGLIEIRKLLDTEEDTDIGFDVREGFLIIESMGCKMSVRLIDGEFPDYNQVIPQKKGVVANMSAASFAAALRRAVLMVSDKNKCVRLDFNSDNVSISSSSPELGDSKEDLAIQYSGKPITIGFNARYILEFIASIGEERQLFIELHGDTGPGKFYAEDDESCIGIVMPMRLA